MKVISIMYDSLSRYLLSPYGYDFTTTENFRRLQERTVAFDCFYMGSLPCMSVRRETYTGRYNFLHRSWGPMEPYDNSVYGLSGKNRIYTHSTSDRAHYWQEGGLTYHIKFSTYESVRGQEGDLWKKGVCGYADFQNLKRQEYVNRECIKDEEDFPHVRVFCSTTGFLEKDAEQDNWCLHMEYFDPHEPLYMLESYKKMYSDKALSFDWPPYEPIIDEKTPESVRLSYCALLIFCDTYLGKLLDFMDERDMRKDTMLIVNTDHGFLLGEHGYYAKNYMPPYEEIIHPPLFIWDPVSGGENVRNQALSRITNIASALCDLFRIGIPEQMQGRSLLPVLRQGTVGHEYALFGGFGKYINITDRDYVYTRLEREETLYNYTIMPTHIFAPFSAEELKKAERELCDSFESAKGVPLMKIPAEISTSPDNSSYWHDRHMEYGDLLFDLKEDLGQNHPIKDKAVEERMKEAMIRLMKESETLEEQYKRLGLQERHSRRNKYLFSGINTTRPRDDCIQTTVAI